MGTVTEQLNPEVIEESLQQDVSALESEFENDAEAFGLTPDADDLMSLTEFLAFINPEAVLEWNSRAQMAEGEFTVNGQKYRVVTTVDTVYIGYFETNMGRAFPRYSKDDTSYIYPPPVLRFIGLPETLFEPETRIVEGSEGTKFVIIEVPAKEITEVDATVSDDSIQDDTDIPLSSFIGPVEYPGDGLDWNKSEIVSELARDASDGQEVAGTLQGTYELALESSKVEKPVSLWAIASIIVALVLILTVLFFKGDKGKKPLNSRAQGLDYLNRTYSRTGRRIK